MATKVKLMKLLQEMRGFSELSRREPLPKPSPFYLLQLRSHVSGTRRVKRRLIVTITEEQHIPDPVQIKFKHAPAK